MNKKTISIITGLLLTAPIEFYLACIFYSLIMHLLFYIFTMAMIVVHLSGIHPLVYIFMILSNFFEGLCVNHILMYILSSTMVLYLNIYLLRRFSLTTKKYVKIIEIFFFGVLLLADMHYGITPFTEKIPIDKEYNYKKQTVDYKITLEKFRSTVTDRNTGSIVETQGILLFNKRMKRFELTDKKETTITIYFHRGGKTVLSELHKKDKPRYYNDVQEYINGQVQLMGKCTRSSLDVDVSNIQFLTK